MSNHASDDDSSRSSASGRAPTSAPSPSGERDGGGRGRRRPPRSVEVVSRTRLAARFVSIVLGGDGLRGFATPEPTSHIKLFLPAPGEVAPPLPETGPNGTTWPEGASRPVVRTYTPRRFDERSSTLEVQFLLHGTGPASEWGERARVGDQLGVAGPGGRFSFDPSIERWWVAGDESALPAIGTLLDALPPSAMAEVHVEVAGPGDELPLAGRAHTSVTWHQRGPGDASGDALYRAAGEATIPAGTQVWVACEAVAVRRIRARLLNEQQLPASSVVTRGYWRLGVADHPDHDYGED